MARLRKPSPNEPTIFAPPKETRATRSSPRKATRKLRYTSSSSDNENPVLVPKSSRRDLRLANSTLHDTENSFLSSRNPSTSDALTPRKQRILRPMESNSRLLRKLSDESLASPEKKQRERRVRSGTTDTDVGKRGGLLYAKSLAKSVVNKRVQRSNLQDVEVADVEEIAAVPRPSVEEEAQVEMQDEEADEEAETSLWCGDEHHTQEEDDIMKDEGSSEDDEDPIITLKHRRRQPPARRVVSDSDEDESEDQEEGFEIEEPVQEPSFKLPERKLARSVKEEQHMLTSMPPPHKMDHSPVSNWEQEVIDLTDSPNAPSSFVLPPPDRMRSASFASSRPTSSASGGALAVLTYSPTPTKKRSPCKAPPISRPATPPLAPPSPSKLVSPSKKKLTIPKATHLDGRPSLDAFWNPVDVNDWNERHSPSKPLVSPKKQKWREDIVKMMEGIALEDSSDEGYESPTTSPKKQAPLRSPTKKQAVKPVDATPNVKAVRAQRKAFSERKHTIAEAFLTELDTTISQGRISALSEATGGIKLVWSKTLKTTAGRANWRREQIRIRTGPLPTDTKHEIRHHCSIELAEKVIDDEERLYNVLAHEFCHLTTFMISEVRNNPHGAEFKTWGRKATAAFASRGVKVTTKHSYQIEYKYVWECVACGYEFKRHSKSVDPARHSCGKCKGRLAQTKPTPRGVGAGVVGKDGKREKSEYQVFVKENFARVKAGLLERGRDAQMGRVMEEVAREYREWKARKGVGKETVVVDVDELDVALDGLQI